MAFLFYGLGIALVSGVLPVQRSQQGMDVVIGRPMQRHEITLPDLDPFYLAAKQKIGKTARALPKRQYGRTNEKLGMVQTGITLPPAEIL